MCGRYAVTLPPDAMRALFQTVNALDYPPRYNIAPTQPIVAIWQANGRREAGLLRWGLVPGWVDDPRAFPLIINARAESMADKPTFKPSLRNQRCIIPASGYYEWKTGPDGRKQPHYITRRDGAPLTFAGLHATWAGPNGEEIESAAIVTTTANAELADIHTRMPAILRTREVEQWLDTAHIDASAARALAQPFDEGEMAAHPVSRRVNAVRNDAPDLIAPQQEGVAEPTANPAPAGAQLDLF